MEACYRESLCVWWFNISNSDGGFQENSSSSGRQKEVGSSGIEEIEHVDTLVIGGWIKEMRV